MSPQIVRRCLLAAAMVVATWNLADRRAETPAAPADGAPTANVATADVTRSVLAPVDSGAATDAGGGVQR